eukprot:CCRYP_018821-RA/>CCRYP_018821-RA protein AED:0.31 eAED:0.31 QI:319/-1/0/1/-1/0/1/0/282
MRSFTSPLTIQLLLLPFLAMSSCSAFVVPLISRRVILQHTPCRQSIQRRLIRPSSPTILHARFFSSFPPTHDTNNNTDTNNEQHPKRNQTLLLHPTAPLHPLLHTPHDKSHPSHLHHYTLPPLTIGVDDYRPILPRGQRIVAIGDVHGDVSALHRFLVAARVIDPHTNTSTDMDAPIWTGGNTLLVQTGDILDRGGKELHCFRILCSLAHQAQQSGGQVYLLYGNHESLNAAGLFQYAFPEGNGEFEETFGKKLDESMGGNNRWRLQFGGNEPARWAALEPG